MNKSCNYCKDEDCTTDHRRWKCKYFDTKRKALDKDIAEIPTQWLLLNIRSGIAPTMRLEGEATFWGKNFDDSIDEKTKKLLGMDLELHTQGKNREETEARKEAIDIIDDQANRWLNARQVILKYKMPHGSGTNPQFPTERQIDIQMQESDEGFFVEIYGDGSVTDPTCWWAALGGFGSWMPRWTREE